MISGSPPKSFTQSTPFSLAHRTHWRAVSGVITAGLFHPSPVNGTKYANIRGGTVSFLALRSRSRSDQSIGPYATPRVVVTPCASQSLYTYSASGAFGSPPV